MFYFDTALADFLESLRHEGLYDNSVIAIVSDHNEYDKNRIYDPTNTDYSPDDTFCTFLVLNPP